MNKINWNFNNTYFNLSEPFREKINPTPVKKPEIILLNNDLSKLLSLDFSKMSNSELSNVFSGNLLPAGSTHSPSICWTSIWSFYYAWRWKGNSNRRA